MLVAQQLNALRIGQFGSTISRFLLGAAAAASRQQANGKRKPGGGFAN